MITDAHPSGDLSVDEIKDRFNMVKDCMLTCKLVDGKKSFKHKGRYYPDLIPPNWDQARKHQAAWQVAHQNKLELDEEYELCPCCQQQIHKKLIDIQDDIVALSFLGSGYPLYFNFIRYSIAIIGLLFLTSGQFTLLSNLLGDDCSSYQLQVEKRYGTIVTGEGDRKHLSSHLNHNNFKPPQSQNLIVVLKQIENYCENDIISRASIANKRFDTSLELVGDWLNLTSTLTILVLIFLFRKSQLQIDTICDIRENTPPDYTMMCVGFPQVENVEEVIKQFFEKDLPSQGGESHPELVVMKINPVYYMEDVDKINQERVDLIEKKKSALSKLTFGTDLYYTTMWDYDKQILTKQKEVQDKSKEVYSDKTKFSGVAFVSFEREDQKQYLLHQAHFSMRQVVFNCFLGCLVHNHKHLVYKDIQVQVTQAPEPTDIIWENIIHNQVQRFSKRVFGFCLSKVVIFIFIVILLLTARLQASYSDQLAAQQPCTIEFNQIEQAAMSASGQIVYPQQAATSTHHLFAFGCSLFTVFINSFVVDQLSRFLVKYEGYETFSQYNVSLASKLSITLFFNSALIAYFSGTYFTQNFYGPSGLIYMETYFFLSNAVVPPMINLVDSNRILKKLYRWWYKRQGNQCTLTQNDANLLQEHPEHEIELRYADIMKTLYITFFYAPLIPIGYIISFFALCVYYWVEKYVLLRRQTVKHTPSIHLSLLMTEMMEYLPIMYAFANMLFKYQILGYFSILSVVATIISGINSFLPMQSIVEKYFSPAEQVNQHFNLKQDETTTYLQAAPNFTSDYELENPITRHLVDSKIYESRRNTLNLDQEIDLTSKQSLHLQELRQQYEELPAQRGKLDLSAAQRSRISRASQQPSMSYQEPSFQQEV